MFSGEHDILSKDSNLFCDLTDHQYTWELNELIRLYKCLPNKKYVLEVGSYLGGTLKQWVNNGSKGTTFISIDTNVTQDIVDIYPHVVLTDDSIVKTWETWLDGDMKLVAIRDSSHSQEAFNKLLSVTKYIDFLYIDGDHSYEGVKSDFITYGPLVRKGGIIAFHDISVYQGDVCVSKLWDEIQKAGYVTRELCGMVDLETLQYTASQGVIFI